MVPPMITVDVITSSLKVPKGFPKLLEKLSLEVLRNQPSDIVRFASQHFVKLLEERKNQAIDLEQAATTIQKHYRGFIERKKFVQKKKETDQVSSAYHDSHLQRTQSATTIQATFRGYQVRKAKGEVQKILNRADALGLETSVIKIQATYRGYRTRMQLKDKTYAIAEENNRPDSREIKSFLDDVEKAAIVIQRNYKCYMARKNFHDAKHSELEEKKMLYANEDKEELEKAALVIQKQYKAFISKKKENKCQQKSSEMENLPTVSEANSEQREKAATVLQKNYKVYMARKKSHDAV